MYRIVMCVSAGALFISNQATAQQKTLKEQLAGIWAYVSSEMTLPNGTTAPSRFGGTNVKGIFILDASGRYADIEMRPDRPKFNGDPTNSSDAEFGAAAKGFAANFGTWSVNEADKTIIMQHEGALVPNFERIERKASVSLIGDELKLVEPSLLGGGSVLTEVLRRAK
jgi:Lipocalin-like domain